MRLASVTFGGGNPTMAAMHREMVAGRKWLTGEQYSICYALARITPGTNMLAFCAGTAWELLGWPGAIAGVLAASVPAALVVMLLTEGYDALRANPLAMAAVAGTLAAAVGMMATAAWELRLYVAGQTAKSLTAFANLKKICEEHITGTYNIEVVDLLKNPKLAHGDQILAIPTLVRKLPAPMRKILGTNQTSLSPPRYVPPAGHGTTSSRVRYGHRR